MTMLQLRPSFHEKESLNFMDFSKKWSTVISRKSVLHLGEKFIPLKFDSETTEKKSSFLVNVRKMSFRHHINGLRTTNASTNDTSEATKFGFDSIHRRRWTPTPVD